MPYQESPIDDGLGVLLRAAGDVGHRLDERRIEAILGTLQMGDRLLVSEWCLLHIVLARLTRIRPPNLAPAIPATHHLRTRSFLGEFLTF